MGTRGGIWNTYMNSSSKHKRWFTIKNLKFTQFQILQFKCLINMNIWTGVGITSFLQESIITLRVIPAPNQTSPVTSKLSSPTIPGIDLKRLWKSLTWKKVEKKLCDECKLMVGALNQGSKLKRLYIFKFWS